MVLGEIPGQGLLAGTRHETPRLLMLAHQPRARCGSRLYAVHVAHRPLLSFIAASVS